MTRIYSNGSGAVQPIENLLVVLAKHPLDIDRFSPGRIMQDSDLGDCTGIAFFGNFRDVSHVFRLWSNDPEVVEPLANAITMNLIRQGVDLDADGAPDVR